MTSTVDPINLLERAASNDTGIDREALARLLVEIARNVDPDYRVSFREAPTADPRMETLRQLLVGREISELSRVAHLLDEPEQLAAAVGNVLPSATAQASHVQLSEVFAPVVEGATRRSVQKNPRTLTEILYPLLLPAIRKSIGEKIDATFQSLNESLKYIFTLRGLKWRLESWRTGTSFAEVVLKHSLVYRVEHAFLIHRLSGLLISHVSAENATSEDPQLISSMLSAIQDFVKDSFNEKDQEGLDTIRFGELRLWSEPGPFATLAVVIRGNPPEELHEILGDVLLRIHADHAEALEQFDGDSSKLIGIETQLQTCVDLKQHDSHQGFPWLLLAAALLILGSVGGWLFSSWQTSQRWQAYVSRLESQPGIIVTEQKMSGRQFYVAGLRDPLAADPQSLLSGTQVDPARVHSRWQFYQSLQPEFVLKRLTASLAPPPSVRLSIADNRILAEGDAPAAWIDRARAAAQQFSAGGPFLDVRVREVDPEKRAEAQWQDYVSRLENQPGITVGEHRVRDGQFYIAGLRDPLAIDPQSLLSETQIDPARIHSNWQYYESLQPEFVLQRLTASLAPPKSVRLSIIEDHILAEGEAPAAWIDSARAAARQLSAGGPALDISRVREVDPQKRDAERWRAYLSRLETEPGIIIGEQRVQDGQFYIAGLRDPLAADPQALLSGTQIDPARVHSHWQSYESIEPELVLKRLTASLAPSKSIRLSVADDRIVAEGDAPAAWINRARAAAQQLPAGGPMLDVSRVREVDPQKLDEERWQAYVSQLENQPGIIITEQKVEDGQFHIRGLRDPLAADPLTLLAGAQVDPARVQSHWQLYESFQSEFVLKRLTASLAPPKSVRLSIVDNRIIAEGDAPATWIARARAAAQRLSADGLTLEVSNLRDISLGVLNRFKDAIQAIDILFDSGKAVPGTTQMAVLDKLATHLKELTEVAREAGVTTRFMLTGHSDATGRETANLSLSLARAETVRALLKKRGVDPELLSIRGAGAFEPAESDDNLVGKSANRRVKVTVSFE